ncbi:hypothetical protein PV05_01942 [Exophiala xenobiotica]|uniref:Alcohol dehydrogenase-like N-terminal domain-containing protein n=1 Tax=Exophiala xenobiotica TaxID=348802 RepID=A0A0D2CA58_9EURO|nr:uncharacterized protein PV05_01942 [Exophiala xenobiotica]KIW61871.1 hypothetical protein PV05_01942 [Exophiala xenobiotica]
MKAIGVEQYGDAQNLISKAVPKQESPQGYDLLARDDYPDYYDRVPRPFQIFGFDGAGIIEAAGPDVKDFKPGDEVFYSGNAEYQLVESRSVAKKPKALSFVEAAALPLTYITAYEALVECMEIEPGEQSALLVFARSSASDTIYD